MPRTKYVRGSKTKKKKSSTNVNLENALNEEVENEELNTRNMLLKQIDDEYQIQLGNLDRLYKEVLEQVETLAFVETSKLDPKILNMTLAELKTESSLSGITAITNSMSASVLKILNNTKNNTLARSRKMNNSDEGYLTANDVRPSSSDRARAQEPKSIRKNIRRSRSLSASKVTKHVSIHPSANTQTPPKTNMNVYSTLGAVTPKLRPNLPLAVLRRPKQGETAISLQGSPLAVSGVVTEDCANVNIPLQDGRIISLQPTRGIRESQVPELDENTMRQLLVLRDNLNKVVQIRKGPS